MKNQASLSKQQKQEKRIYVIHAPNHYQNIHALLVTLDHVL